mgnify:CR=1 FL=1
MDSVTKSREAVIQDSPNMDNIILFTTFITNLLQQSIYLLLFLGLKWAKIHQKWRN